MSSLSQTFLIVVRFTSLALSNAYKCGIDTSSKWGIQKPHNRVAFSASARFLFSDSLGLLKNIHFKTAEILQLMKSATLNSHCRNENELFH